MVQAAATAEAARVGAITLPSSSKENAKPTLPPANRFAAAVCGVLGGAALGGALVDALLLAHHPMVCHSSKGAISLWAGITRRAFGGVEGINCLLQDEGIASDVAAGILSAMQAPVVYDRWAVLS